MGLLLLENLTNHCKNVLVIGSEVHSGGLDMTTRGRGVSIVFGAGAIVIQAIDDNSKGVLSSHLHSEGKNAEELSLVSPSTTDWMPNFIERNDPEDTRYYLYMNGNFVPKNAVVRFQQVIMEALGHNGYKPEDIDMLIPHQANLRISQFIQKQMNLSNDNAFNNNIHYHPVSPFINNIDYNLPEMIKIQPSVDQKGNYTLFE